MLLCTFPNKLSANVCSLWKLLICFSILHVFPTSTIRIICSDCKLVQISAVSPQGTFAVLAGSTTPLQGCAIMMINESAKILLLQLPWNVSMNVSSVGADLRAQNVSPETSSNWPPELLSVPDNCLKPHPPYPTGVTLLCTQLFSSCGGSCHLRYLTDKPLDHLQFCSREVVCCFSLSLQWLRTCFSVKYWLS